MAANETADKEFTEEKRETVIYSRCKSDGDHATIRIKQAFYFEPIGEDMTLYAPAWPFMKWSDDGKTDQCCIAKELNNTESSCLSMIVERCRRKINKFEDSTSKNILTDIHTTMTTTLEKLCSRHQIFKHYELKLAGSVSEGTKIGHANEFDYLLTLNVFEDVESFRLDLRQHFLRIEVINAERENDMPDPDMLYQEDDKQFVQKLRKTLMTLFVDEFQIQLAPGWILNREDGQFCLSSIATTLHLQCTKYDLEVDIDICLCCPISPRDIENTLMYQNKKLDEMEEKFFRYLKQRNDINPLKVYAIIANDQAIFPGVMKTRIASLPLEMEMISRFGQEDGRIQSYCVSKCIAESFLPKVTELCGCKRCCHRLARSYHLKNILFFMMKQYHDDKDWVSELIGERVLELFNMLRLCVSSDNEEQAEHSVSTFCTPGLLRLEDISTFNPCIPKDRRGTGTCEFLFTKDSHKPLYQLSSCPKMKDFLRTGNLKANYEIEHWFSHLNGEQWNTFELFKDLYNLLEKLSKLSSET